LCFGDFFFFAGMEMCVEQVGIARLVRTANSGPMLVALVPQPEEVDESGKHSSVDLSEALVTRTLPPSPIEQSTLPTATFPIFTPSFLDHNQLDAAMFSLCVANIPETAVADIFFFFLSSFFYKFPSWHRAVMGEAILLPLLATGGQIDPPGFHAVVLPFADDLRELPPLPATTQPVGLG
jgi:hypothetical protein